ncbi:MAG: thymidine phosphorylase [Candidatus Cloacimonetes bacterium]|nr:thymidine phosphorylase [Candidatus Cloacimonadota bacterium]
MLNPVEIILKKRIGNELTLEEMFFIVNNYINGNVPDYQMSAFLMAIFFKGMSKQEIVNLTRIYVESGSKIDFPKELKTVDKHSTGGVGDKITMTLAPIVAACGGYIPMISGRGLGHTGGTLDKLESIPGFNTFMTEAVFKEKVLNHKLAIIAQSADIVPADKKIYALRDVTATVESLPLICASIMSKKIAEGSQNLVIDLKVGSGAFMKTLQEAEKLADLLVFIGESFGQKVSIVFTRMDSPIGYAIGNALEIKECIEYLQGKIIPDIDKITKTLAVEMLKLCFSISEAQCVLKINEVINNGTALKKFEELVSIQGGDPNIVRNTSILPSSKIILNIVSNQKGYVININSQQIGYSLIKIGAGRTKLDSPLDMGSGVYFYKKIGDFIEVGEIIGEVHCASEKAGNEVVQDILNAINISETKVFEKKDVIIGIRNVLNQ